MPDDIAELLDFYHDRTIVDDGEDRVAFDPGKIISKVLDRMDHFAVAPVAEVSPGDFASWKEIVLLGQAGMLPLLVRATASQAGKLLHRELTAPAATHSMPAEFDLVETTGLSLTVEQIETARRMFNLASSDPSTPEHDLDPDSKLDGLSIEDQGGVFVAMLAYYLLKRFHAHEAGAEKNPSGPPA